MYRKMTLLAFGAKWGFLGARGLTNLFRPSAATACLAKNPSPSIDESATETKPAPPCQRNSRRVRPQKFFVGLDIGGQSLVQVDELVQVERQEAEVGEGGGRV